MDGEFPAATARGAADPGPRHWTRATWALLRERFARDRALLWPSLSRLTNLVILLNISLFFLTQMVTREHYSFTIYSVILLALVHAGMVLPLGLLDRLGYYLALLAIEAVAVYLLVASIVYWIGTSHAAAP